MSVGSDPSDDKTEVMSEINTTPLVDVMLVLLVIFLITIPVITKTVVSSLPKAVNIPTQTKPENVTVEVDQKGNIYWNSKLVKGRDELLNLIKEAAVRKPQPELHIRADKDVRYESVGRVIYTIQRGGIVKVGFITEPDHGMAPVRN
ncbi:MAG TPA: biopolymer transporter ExbD [Steroidobacteraceae bacterium]|jgi:biopolymer transport protein ExbD|nr:biopolymer transporter ExbD [Steroidobacteraceae bacterium]